MFAGKIVNLMASDVIAVQTVLHGICNIWSAPMRIVVALALLYLELGWPVLIGALVLGLAIPLQKVIVGKSSKLFRSALKSKDVRVKAIGEVMEFIAIIKQYAWEESFGESIESARAEEVGNTQCWSLYINAMSCVSYRSCRAPPSQLFTVHTPFFSSCG
jgi:ABC-type multidrug transport system fused ATPase/permease subunit